MPPESTSGAPPSETDPDGTVAEGRADGPEQQAAGTARGPANSGVIAAAATESALPATGAVRWWLVLFGIAVVEFWVFGRRGELEVCVGKAGHTDFSLAGAERTDENRWEFPRCESRLNLGLRSRYETELGEATMLACRGATIFTFRGEAPACVAREDGWQHEVETRFVWPWDERYYNHLFWFLQ